MVESNRKNEEGRSDIVVKDVRSGKIAVFEAKYSKTLEVLCYGIAFYKKHCLVRKKE